MAEENDDKKPDQEVKEEAQAPSEEVSLDVPANEEPEVELDEDLAEALGDDATETDGEEVDVDQAIAEADPNFKDEIEQIAKQDFSGVVIEKDKVSSEVAEDAKVPSAFRSFVKNLPADLKNRYKMVALVIAITVPLAILILKGKVLPTFKIAYNISMDELSQDVFTYPTDGTEVPLFDEFRTDSHTVELPKTVINLKPEDGRQSYGEFTFSLVLRDKDLSSAIAAKRSEIIDLIQRVLEEVTWKQLQNPSGKERVKKIIRHRLNEYLQGNVVLGVYYREVILEK